MCLGLRGTDPETGRGGASWRCGQWPAASTRPAAASGLGPRASKLRPQGTGRHLSSALLSSVNLLFVPIIDFHGKWFDDVMILASARPLSLFVPEARCPPWGGGGSGEGRSHPSPPYPLQGEGPRHVFGWSLFTRLRNFLMGTFWGGRVTCHACQNPPSLCVPGPSAPVQGGPSDVSDVR